MLQGKGVSGKGAGPSAASLYLFIDACQLHAAVYSQGDWISDSMMEVDINRSSVDSENAQDAVIDALRLLQSNLELRYKKQDRQFTGIEIYVGLSECWFPNETMPWSDALQSRSASDVVAMHLVQSGFPVEPEDVLRWAGASWGEPRWAVAYPHALLRKLEELAHAISGVLVSVVPAATAVAALFRQSGRRDGAVAYLSCGQLCLLEVRNGLELSTLQRSFEFTAKEYESTTVQQEALLRAWKGIQLRAPHLQSLAELNVVVDHNLMLQSSPSGLSFLQWPDASKSWVQPLLRCLQMVNVRSNVLNAVNQNTALNVRSVLALFLSIVVVTGLLWSFLANVKTIRQLEAKNQNPISSTYSDQIQLSAVTKERVAAVNVAIRQLNMPVAELLRTLHPPKDIPVALLGVDLSDGGVSTDLPRIRVSAQSPSGEDMTRYLGFLNGRKPFVHAYLIRHEVVQIASENHWRFTMELTWRP